MQWPSGQLLGPSRSPDKGAWARGAPGSLPGLSACLFVEADASVKRRGGSGGQGSKALLPGPFAH